MEFIRRMSTGTPEMPHSNPHTLNTAHKHVTVDTNVKSGYRNSVGSVGRMSFRHWSPEKNDDKVNEMTGSPGSTRSIESHDGSVKRRRSNSECLQLAKNGECPVACQAYISSVKQILARKDSNSNIHRPRSTSMKTQTSP